MFELKDTLSPILVSLFSLFILGQFSTVEGNIIEGKLWTYEPNVPHQTPIVVEAISIEEHTGQVTQSDVMAWVNSFIIKLKEKTLFLFLAETLI